MSGSLALLRTLRQWEIVQSTVPNFLLFSCKHRGGQGALASSKFLAYLGILCFDRECSEQNTVAR